MFSKKGVITVNTGAIDENALMDIALSAGAEDLQNTGQLYEITCEPAAYDTLKAALEEKKIPLASAELSRVPQTTVPIHDEETARKILNLMEDFEDHDDVQNVYANFDIPDPILAKIEG
jgi:transcriptional/translational regulatory protein YebC/TACO1